MSVEWDKLWKDNLAEFWVYKTSPSATQLWMKNVKAVGDKLQEEAEGHKARYDDLHRITVKWQKKIELIQKIAEKDISARLSRYPNTEKTASELLDMVVELKERHSKILWVLSLD